jgi:leucyl-tRNA synthetase
MAIAADHPIWRKGRSRNPELAAFCEECRRAGTSVAAWKRRRKRASTPAFASRIRSIQAWTLPVYVANFVLMDYGTGAIFGCPSTISATSISPANTACRSFRSSCRRADAATFEIRGSLCR